ncbi:hypothetical protein [Niabella aquatica]
MDEENIAELFYMFLKYNELFGIDEFFSHKELDKTRVLIRSYFISNITNEIKGLADISILNGFVNFEKGIKAVISICNF